MARLTRCATLAAALLLAGCGSHFGPVPAACTQGASSVVRALRAAPQSVRLPDGTRLSDCLRHATSDVELQNVGGVLVEAGSRIAAHGLRDARAVLELGYLAGSVESGARRTGGVASELVDRMGRFVGDSADLAPAARAAFERGLAAGRADG